MKFTVILRFAELIDSFHFNSTNEVINSQCCDMAHNQLGIAQTLTGKNMNFNNFL